MAIRVKARNGESVEQMLRRFKKLCEKEGLTKEIKRRAFAAGQGRLSAIAEPPWSGTRPSRRWRCDPFQPVG
ncbi:MAG: 30S ribosomal protein S21 [Planctomycetota bacterium]